MFVQRDVVPAPHIAAAQSGEDYPAAPRPSHSGVRTAARKNIARIEKRLRDLKDRPPGRLPP
jgi:hypothetical protein